MVYLTAIQVEVMGKFLPLGEQYATLKEPYYNCVYLVFQMVPESF
jgi:hypothetical protein